MQTNKAVLNSQLEKSITAAQVMLNMLNAAFRAGQFGEVGFLGGELLQILSCCFRCVAEVVEVG